MTSQSAQKPRLNTAHLPTPVVVSPTSSTDGGSISPLLPSFVPRPTTVRHTTSQSLSIPSTRSLTLTSQQSSSNVILERTPRLLMPTVRQARPSPACILPKTTRFSPSKNPRSRAGSLVHTVPPSPDPNASPAPLVDWIGGGLRFEVVEEQIELSGYQIYAVEKWVVDRHRPVTVLTVFTGDPNHKITVTALIPLSTFLNIEAQYEWDKAIHSLRRDGARPKQTSQGVIMVTSLANFRSDFTIVHIPGGNYLDVREQLYANINVLRMGCSGRSALTLEEPSETTKDRFVSSYFIPDKPFIRTPGLFKAVVLELIKLVQAALAISGMFDMSREERDGLLCDVTCEGIQRWVAEIGEPCVNVEPMERVADPTVVAALLSLVLTVRNRLNALGQYVPKDPFIDPPAFVKALTSFMTSKQHSHNHSMSIPHHIPISNITMNPMSSPSPSFPPQVTYLDQKVYEAVSAAYDKGKQNEPYKVHRVLINKLDDLATDLRTNPDKGSFGWSSNLNPTTDLGKFARIITANSKDGSPSVRYFWTGRPGEVARKRKEREAIWSEGEEKEREKEIEDKERGRIEREKEKDREAKTSEDETDFMGGIPWSGRVQKKLESWAAITRGKKSSVDFYARAKGYDSPLRGQPVPNLPSVVISRYAIHDDDMLTSGQGSPVSDAHVKNPLRLGVGGSSQARRSNGELSDYDRKVTEFNQRNPPARPYTQARIVSWADPQTARDSLVDDDDSKQRRGTSPSTRPASQEVVGDGDEGLKPKRVDLQALKRHRSFDDVGALHGTRILPPERMRIDVELCGQTLMLRRREEHLENVIACLEALTSTLSASNSTLRGNQTSKQAAIDALHVRAGVLQDIEAMRAHADAMTQETNALAYESAQFRVDDLWHMAAAPREKVLGMRERVFGTGRRLPQGVQGAHGRFNRMQWTLDGGTRLVDIHGRTESEAEDEIVLPWIVPLYGDEDEGDVVEHANLKPTWLLRFFNYWGSKWGPTRNKKDGPDGSQTEAEEQGKGGVGSERARSMSGADAVTASGLELRTTLVRNNTA
ncbi:hypothetical protein BDY19DRAFT_898854 [Irpex rosettiformis]|uniref:Uncharacterized protein n=1 Tax=Irpex rosettiformis TaxID=378272 RepID=A0ACB8TQ89_9APHY|nr:hypothetical protein BDY19DRAFT_898854 [Irpex rosettiformis]